MILAIVDHIEGQVQRAPLTPAPSGGQRDRRMGGPAVPRGRGGMEADRVGSRRRMAQRVRAALPALRAVADLRLAVLPRPRHPAGARAPGEQGDRALLSERRRGPRARPRTAGADRHRRRADHNAHDPPRPVLQHLHDLQPRPRGRPPATRRPRVLDLLLGPRERPAPPRRRFARDRRGPLGGAATAVHPEWHDRHCHEAGEP